jgi:hypothetical protein
MSFTYDLSQPTGQLRLLIPDNNVTAVELQDDELAYFLAQRGGNVRAAAVDACQHLSRKYAQQPTFTADGLQFAGNSRAETFAARAKELARSMTGGMSTAKLTRNDGYAQVAADSEYETDIVYVEVEGD